MQPTDEKTAYRIWGRIEHVGPYEFVVTATAIPDNGDPASVQTLTETLPSLEAARLAARALVEKMRRIVPMKGGHVEHVEIQGL